MTLCCTLLYGTLLYNRKKRVRLRLLKQNVLIYEFHGEKELIQRAADLMGVSVFSFFLQSLHEKAVRLIQQHEQGMLSLHFPS
ncbi:MAG: DUF1778 domain-containing protein [bacterium]